MSNDVAASMDQDFSNTPGGCHRGFFRPGPVVNRARGRGRRTFFQVMCRTPSGMPTRVDSYVEVGTNPLIQRSP